MDRKIVIIAPDEEPLFDIDDEEPIGIDENADEYEEMIRRQDDIDELTSDYIRGLLGDEEYGIDLLDLGIDSQTLEAIEDAFEHVLHEFGIYIYRPQVVTDEDGNESIASCAYADFQ